ncbi:hypothetical protein Tco_0709685 [Tanacetum coccineum]
MAGVNSKRGEKDEEWEKGEDAQRGSDETRKGLSGARTGEGKSVDGMIRRRREAEKAYDREVKTGESWGAARGERKRDDDARREIEGEKVSKRYGSEKEKEQEEERAHERETEEQSKKDREGK